MGLRIQRMNRESLLSRRFPRKTIGKKLCRAISRNKASTSLVLWKLDGSCRNDFVITTVLNSRAQCREMICTWIPGLIRFQTGCRSRLAPDAVPLPHGRSRSTISFRQTSIEFLLSLFSPFFFFFFYHSFFYHENSANLDRNERSKGSR